MSCVVTLEQNHKIFCYSWNSLRKNKLKDTNTQNIELLGKKAKQSKRGGRITNTSFLTEFSVFRF